MAIKKYYFSMFSATYHEFLELSHQRRSGEKVSNNRKDFPFQLGDSFEEKQMQFCPVVSFERFNRGFGYRLT
jgi:hypothetical protein